MRLDIYGSFIDSEYEREDENDITPNIFKESISELKSGNELEIHINSCGGNCTSGIAIANQIRKLNSEGIKTICVIDGICASIATLIAMACNELKMYEQSFLMIHNPWSFVQGDAEAMRKEAVSLDAMKKAILSFYHEKFNLTDDELCNYMNQETWISGIEKDTYHLNATIIEGDNQYKMSAKLVDKIQKKFNNKTILDKISNMEKEETKEIEVVQPEAIPEENIEKTDEVKVEEQITEEKTESIEEVEKTENETSEEKPSYEELEKLVEELTNKVKALEEEKEQPIEERISKCQSTFQNKINNFKKEIKAKDEELQTLKDSVSSLNTQLEETKKELHDMSASFQEKNTALTMLNSSVLSNPAEIKDWKTLKGKEFFDFIKTHPEITK